MQLLELILKKLYEKDGYIWVTNNFKEKTARLIQPKKKIISLFGNNLLCIIDNYDEHKSKEGGQGVAYGAWHFLA